MNNERTEEELISHDCPNPAATKFRLGLANATARSAALHPRGRTTSRVLSVDRTPAISATRLAASSGMLGWPDRFLSRAGHRLDIETTTTERRT